MQVLLLHRLATELCYIIENLCFISVLGTGLSLP